MLGHTPTSTLKLAGAVLGLAGLAAVTGVAFAGWIDNDAGIFRAMIEAGLAWCM